MMHNASVLQGDFRLLMERKIQEKQVKYIFIPACRNLLLLSLCGLFPVPLLRTTCMHGGKEGKKRQPGINNFLLQKSRAGRARVRACELEEEEEKVATNRVPLFFCLLSLIIIITIIVSR